MQNRDTQSLIANVGQTLIERNLSITAAESLTSGMFQSNLADVAGISAIFPGGFVTYANEAKETLLDIPKEIISQYGVVSKHTAIWMAQQAKAKLQTNIAISFTGVAGPDSLENQPAGTVWIGLAYRNETPFGQLFHFTGNRNQVREQSVHQGFQLLKEQLQTDHSF